MTEINTKYDVTAAASSMRGGRSENQDCIGYADTPLGLVIIVCDGMGGGPGGKTASRMAATSIAKSLQAMQSVPSGGQHSMLCGEALHTAVSQANDALYAKASETPELRGMGTTAAVLLINDESVVVAHVGDTRLYQLRGGRLKFKTFDHSAVAELVKRKRLTEEQARNHPQSNIITRALGIRPTVDVEVNELKCRPGDRFILCTDGIWGVMPEKELMQRFSNPMSPSLLTTEITEEINNIGKASNANYDNLSLVIADVGNRTQQKPLASIWDRVISSIKAGGTD